MQFPRAYPARFDPGDDGITVTFRDVPEAITCGFDERDAAAMATDALETALSLYLRSGSPPPASAPQEGERPVPVSALASAKLALHEAMRDQGMGKAELARRLRCHLPQVDRLLDLCHQSKLDQMERALAALGKRLVVDVRDAA